MFIDRLDERINQKQSVLCAGFDPTIDSIPQELITAHVRRGGSNQEILGRVLDEYVHLALDTIAPSVACIKPNAAFFEQFGMPGYQALISLSEYAKKLGVPVVLDAKRGDIGSTAQAYAHAYFSPPSFLAQPLTTATCDALTINPFLGFDTLAPFLAACRDAGKGVFILVKTSNPGSADIQNLPLNDSHRRVLDTVAEFVAKEGHTLRGSCGISSVGAVVGATYPGEAAQLRTAMPYAIFLIPGFGAQGGSAQSAVSGFTASGKGGIVNMSRGIFGLPNTLPITEWIAEVRQRCATANQDLQQALSNQVSAHRVEHTTSEV